MNLSISAVLLASCLFGSFTWGADSSSTTTTTTTTTTTKAPTSTTKKATTATASASEARGSRMEISDAQLEMALKDRRYLQRQLKCTLGEAPCDPVGRRLKTLAPLVIRGSCPQCTPTDMRQIQKTLLHIQKNFPKEWAKIVRTYA